MKPEVFLMMAEASLEAYGELSLFSRWFSKIGSGSADLIENRGTQAYCFETGPVDDHDLRHYIGAFRTGAV